MSSAEQPRTETFGRDRLLALDVMRAAAALLVAASHAVAYGTLPMSATAPLCVVFFFILSGFVLAHAYGPAIATGALGFRDFVVIRVARLYPLHLVTMSFVAAFWALVAIVKWTAAALSLQGLNLETTCGATELLEGVALIHFLLGGRVCFNSPSWSISVEFWCSLFVFALLLPWRPLKWALAALALVLFAIVEAHGGFLHSPTQWIGGAIEKNYAVGFGCFVLGWLLRVNYARLSPLAQRIPAGARVAATAALFIFAATSPAAVAGWTWVEIPFIVAFCVVIVLCAGLAPATPRAAAAMGRLGDWSYGFYLWHVPAMIVVTALARLLEKSLGLSLFGTPAIDLAYYPLVVTLAALGYRHLEQPAKHWIRRRFGTARPVRMTAAAVPPG